MPNSQLIRVSAADAADIHANIGLRGRVGVVGNARSSVPDVVTSLGNSINDPANANKDRVDDETSREDGNSPAVAKRKSASSPNRKIGVDIPDASDAVARRQSPDYKRQNTERTSAAAAVDETNLNQLDDMHQYREALLVAKQLIRNGILTSGPASTIRKDVKIEAAPAEEVAAIAGPAQRIAVGRVGEGTKAEEVVAAGEKGGDAQKSTKPDSPTTKIATEMQSRPTWKSMFEELRLYKDAKGHVNVPQSYGPLGLFVNDQRNRYKMLLKGKPLEGNSAYDMTQERANQLEALGFKWSTTKNWGDRVKELENYKANHGHTNVPQSYGSLGSFVNDQRKRYKMLLKGTAAFGMTQEKANQLEALGFKWSLRANHQSWDDWIEQIQEFKKEHGHLNIPRNHCSLGRFVDNQRRLHNLLLKGKPANGMTQERANQLEVLGLKWSRNTTRHSWDDRMEKLREFKKEYGHLNVERSHSFLGNFVNNQRNLHKLLLEGKPAKGMTQERAKELEELGFKWWSTSDSF